jgi:hypothetical protein
MAPIWAPPRAHLDVVGIPELAAIPSSVSQGPRVPLAKVRWPFQPIKTGPRLDAALRIEIWLLANVVRASLGILVLGLLVGGWNWWAGPRQRDSVLTIGWWLAIGQLVAWPCLVFSGVWLISDNWSAGILGAGLLIGILSSAWRLRASGCHAPSR